MSARAAGEVGGRARPAGGAGARARAARALSLGAAWAWAAGACAALPELRAGACGNGVVEAGEDCDRFAGGPNAACGRPGDAELACRFHCDPSREGGREPACPDGYACGGDRVCRRPSGAYEPLGGGFAAGTWRLVTGDFDGDGRGELVATDRPDFLGRAAPRAFFFDAGGSVARSAPLSPRLGPPEVGRLSADGLDDLLAPVFGAGVAVFLGRADRTLAPVAYGTFVLPDGGQTRTFGLDADPSSPGREAVVAIAGPAGELPALGIFDVGDVAQADPDQLVELAPLPGPPADILPHYAVGRFHDDPAASPCERLAFALRGAREVLIFTPCRPDGAGGFEPNAGGALAPIALPAGLTADGGVHAADVDGDGRLDLLVGTRAGGDPDARTAVAYGAGDGTFRAADGAPGAASPLATRNAAPEGDVAGAPKSLPFPLAAGDLNGDGTADFVLGRQIVVSGPSAGGAAGGGAGGAGGAGEASGGGVVYVSVVARLAAAWTEAVIADFNADGLPDVAATSATALDVDVFLGTPETLSPGAPGRAGLFNSFLLSTDGPASLPTPGDFDGDLVTDLAFREAGAPGAGDALAVAYGRRSGPPEPAVRAGQFERIDDVVTADIPSDVGADAADDLGVTSTAGGGARRQVSVLLGSGDRQLLAPFGLAAPGAAPGHDELSGLPLALAVGAFGGARPAGPCADVAALALDLNAIERQDVFDTPARLWLVPCAGEAGLGEPSPGPALPASWSPLVSAVRADDPAGFGVAARLRAGDVDGDGVDEVLALGAGAGGAELLVARAVGGAFVADEPLRLGFDLTPGSAVDLADLDGDGRPDVVAGNAGDAASRPGLWVVWNDGGPLRPEARAEVVPPAGGPVRGFAPVPARAAGRRALVAVTATGAFVATADEGRALTVVEVPGVPGGGASVAAADFDGDGVVDLAIGDAGTVRLYRAKPDNPR